jgi:hypothetical protein
MDTTADKMVESPNQTIYLVRCTGTKEGRPCTAYVDLSATEKTLCPACETVHPPWGSYLATRTKDD